MTQMEERRPSEGLEAGQWVRVREILDFALQLPPDQRAAYVTEVCAGDPALRSEVESLIAASARSAFLDRDLLPSLTPTLNMTVADTGRTIGNYRVLDRIGEGGMGIVFKAVDSRLGRTVALKVISHSPSPTLGTGEETTELIPERVSSTSRLNAGDRVRLMLESPEHGYLYLIDRERYASGERGTPYLIFPTMRTRAGDNKVAGGKLIDIPAQGDRPNFFTLRRSRPDQVAEELTVLLTPEPLEGVTIGENALALSNAQVAAWEKQWGSVKPEVFELTGGAGKAWTRAEQDAAADGTRRLTQDDPPPQTVYRVAVKPGAPLAVEVRLRYSSR